MRIISNRVKIPVLPDLFVRLLPSQGSIELQHDAPGKEHSWHSHGSDETLVLLQGSLRFYWRSGERVCAPGDVIELPAGTQHGSQALGEGATYIIAIGRLGIAE
jgi:quercetin dioxygenase-like cupin family protein